MAAIVITLDGVDITSRVIFESASFESLLNAQPGICEFTCKDPNQDFAPVTGDEITLSVDGVLLWGGYLTQITRTHPFPADLVPVNPDDYTKRYWILRGVDYNILFDKRVLRRTSNYLASLPLVAGSTQDGAAITSMFTNYIDMPAGFDVSTYVDNVTTVSPDGTSEWSYNQQGTKVREQMEQLTWNSAAVYYFDASKNLHWHAIEDVESRWGFSDQPNNATITTSPNEFQNATYGFREVEATEDGTGLVNDALIWGGSAFSGASGGTVFKRTQDTTSQTNHGRWQVGETHFGEPGMGIQDGVDARADAIVLGPPGADAYGQLKGLRYSQWSLTFAWHDKDVPSISGTKIHLVPGQLVTIELATFTETRILPLRSLRISFPEGDPSGGSYVRFDGQFGLQLSDAYTLWDYLVKKQTSTTPLISTVDNSSTSALYGSIYQGEPSPATDGVTAVFTTPFGYIPGTTQVFKDGILQIPVTAYTESDYEAGEITFNVAPAAGTELYVVSRTLAG